MWIPPRLEDAFKNTVVKTFTSPHLYHPVLAPLPWLISVYGRPGLDKLEVLEKLCLTYGLYGSYKSVVVKLGYTTQAMTEIRCIAEATQSVLKEEEDEALLSAKDVELELKREVKPYFIILVDHADILCYEPDSERCLLDALELKEICETNKVLIVGIFDRLPGETQPQTSPWLRECHNKFFTQFNVDLYVEAPSDTFRIQLFKFYISEFEAHYNKTQEGEQPLVVKLNEDDYERLAGFSTFATPENILYFMRKVFLNILQACPDCLDVDYIERFTNQKFGAPHICSYDARDADNHFSTACGFGPAPKPKLKKKNDVVPRVTGFTEENANLDQVMNNLGEESPLKKIKNE